MAGVALRGEVEAVVDEVEARRGIGGCGDAEGAAGLRARRKTDEVGRAREGGCAKRLGGGGVFHVGGAHGKTPTSERRNAAQLSSAGIPKSSASAPGHHRAEAGKYSREKPTGSHFLFTRRRPFWVAPTLAGTEHRAFTLWNRHYKRSARAPRT